MHRVLIALTIANTAAVIGIGLAVAWLFTQPSHDASARRDIGIVQHRLAQDERTAASNAARNASLLTHVTAIAHGAYPYELTLWAICHGLRTPTNRANVKLYASSPTVGSALTSGLISSCDYGHVPTAKPTKLP